MAGGRLNKLMIQAPSGLTYVTHPELAYAEVIKVCRGRQWHYITDDEPGSVDKPKVQFIPAEGKLVFSDNYPFNFAILNPDGSRVIEYIFVIYKRGGGIVEEAGPPITP